MAHRPSKRARRPDSTQMWDASDHNDPIPTEPYPSSRDRDREWPSSRTNNQPNPSDRDRTRRRYRSRSRDRRDRPSWERDRDRGREDRDSERNRGREREGRGRDRDRERRDRDRERDEPDRWAKRREERRLSPNDHSPRRRSASPKQKSHSQTLSFRVHSEGSPMDEDTSHTKDPPQQSKSHDDEAGSEDEVDIEDDSAMKAMLGFGGFGSTKGKHISGNNVGGVRKEKKTEYRQYMNRIGGFNRPLSPPR